MTPQRIQLSRAKGWRMPENTVKVDRSTRWGNPYVIAHTSPLVSDRYPWSVTHSAGTTYSVHATRREAVERAVYLFATGCALRLDLSPLRGKNLACWCQPGSPCHADVLLDLANREQP